MQRYYLQSLTSGKTAILAGDEAHHAAHVMRVKPGKRLILFDGNNHEAEAIVDSVTRKEVVCTIESFREVDREATRMMIVAVALPKGDRARSVIEKSVELGAWGLIPLVCRRSVALPGQGLINRLQRYVIDASKQCGRNRLMQLGAMQTWDELMRADISSLFPAGAIDPTDPWCRLIAHPGGSPFSHFRADRAVFAVGPEGGFDDDEVQQAVEANWESVALGPRILRVETAVGAMLAIGSCS